MKRQRRSDVRAMAGGDISSDLSPEDAQRLAPMLRALAASALVIGLYDPDDTLRYANAAFASLFLHDLAVPVAFADILRHGHARRFGVKVDSGDVERFIADVLQRRRSVPERGFEVDTADGRWLWMTEITLDDGWFLSVGTDITQLKHHERSLRQAHEAALHESQTDALTGLSNRRHMLGQIDQALARLQTLAQPFCLALVDLDHFKHINDRHGHDGGDAVLQHFAVYSQYALRPQDRIGRIGGEEFIVLLEGIELLQALDVIERLRAQLPRAPLGEREVSVGYTFSAGLAEAHAGESASTLIRRVDRALYAAKAAGRNCTQLATA
jgi:diguanylate cyclase (GGDEF)-like protein